MKKTFAMDPKSAKKKLTILLDTELHIRLGGEAKRQGRTMTKLLHCAIASYLGLPMDPEEPRAPSRLTECENQLRQVAMDLAALDRRVIRSVPEDVAARLDALETRLRELEQERSLAERLAKSL